MSDASWHRREKPVPALRARGDRPMKKGLFVGVALVLFAVALSPQLQGGC
jgi:hypothetical protein